MPTNSSTTMLDLDRRAVQVSLDALAPWRPADGDPPTPCAGWRLGDLVAHMTVQQYGFARAFDGERTAIDDWTPVRYGDPVAAYRDSCDAVLAALARLTDETASVLLPEIRDEPLPAGTVVGFHLVDNAVHAWDVAVSLGAEPRLDAELVAAVCEVARAVPDDDRRGRPGSSFARRLPVPAGAGEWAQTLRLLGRDPDWSAP